ncbi:PAS-domain containing protein [Falsiroseomonas sp. HW251]|uniref:PAS-domain containing protein n=1 Tax=Falsiroseomonas sp. HW251 TaxID=3390998 RepID=UPI003D31402A
MTSHAALLAAIEALPHGVAIVDADQRLLLANPALWRLAGCGGMPPGTPQQEFYRLLAYRGLLGPGDPEAHVAAALALDRTRPALRRLRSADGQTVREVVSVPLPGGGYVSAVHDVTGLMQSEAEAQARARMAETVLSHLSGGIVAYDSEHRIRLVNGAFETLTGLPLGTLRPGMSHEDLLAAQVARGQFLNADAAAEMAERMERDRSRRSTRTRERPSGEVLRFESHPLPDGGFVVEVDDVTALKRAEDEATRRAALLDGVLEALPWGVCIFGADRRAQRFNAAYGRLMEGSAVRIGETLEEVVERRLRDGEYDEETAARFVARFAPGAAAGTVRRKRPNGTVLESQVARLPDGGMISVFTEITALHRAEEAARQRAALLDGIVSAMPHGICVFGPDGRVTMFNAAYQRIMEGAPAAIGDHLDELTARRAAAGEYGSPYEPSAQRALRGGGTEEVVRQRPNGTVIAVRVAPLPDGGLVSVITDVTALHRAEQAARERAEVLDSVLESLPDGVVVYGPDRRARLANAAYGRILGDAAVRPGETVHEVMARRVAAGEMLEQEAAALLARRLAPDPVGAEPITRIRPDGQALTSRSARLPDGGHVVIISDVSALFRAEEALRRRAVELETSFAAIRHGIALFGPDERLIAANSRTSDLTGVPETLISQGRSFTELVELQVAHGALTPAQREQALALDRRRQQRYERDLPDGRIVEILSDPTPDGGFVVTYSDVTALHQAEAELRRRAAMQDAMLATMRHGIILYGPDRRVQARNAKTAELTGVPLEELAPGRLIDDLLDEQVARGEMTTDMATWLKASDRTRTQHYSRVRPDGRQVDIVSEPSPDGGFVITYSDVTEDRAIRAELERARAAAEAASEAKSRFLATMSHELRTPLAAVIGFSEAIATEQDRTRVADYAAAVNEAGRHLLQLVDDILDVARSQTGALQTAREPFVADAVLREAVAAVEATAAARGLALSTTIPASLPQLRGDPLRLRQVLDKLLSNALKFTPDGGCITVSAEADAAGLSIRVADTGIGIAPELRERVFEPFTQVDNALSRRFQGSGLGLHLARALTTALGGTLTLEDAQGPGTVALLRFPSVLLKAAPAMAGPLPA